MTQSPPRNKKEAEAARLAAKSFDAVYADEGWLEHLEDELDANLKEDLQLLLRNSQTDRSVLDSLRRTRHAIKASDDVALPESGHYYDALHSKIMSSINAVEAEKKSASKFFFVSARLTRFNRVSVGAMSAAGMSMMMGLIAVFALQATHAVHGGSEIDQARESANEFERKLASVDNPSEASDSMLATESSGDFIVAAAEERLKSMAPEEVDSLLKTLKR